MKKWIVKRYAVEKFYVEAGTREKAVDLCYENGNSCEFRISKVTAKTVKTFEFKGYADASSVLKETQ